MKVPPAFQKLIERFDRMNVRERALIAAALIAAVVMTWDAALMQSLSSRQVSYANELETLQKSIAMAATTVEAAAASDPTSAALLKQKAVQNSLDAVNKELQAASAGLIAPERMVEVLHDVLTSQRDVRLVSLHNEPVRSLIPSEKEGGAEFGPYVHPVELVVEGRYLDISEYMRALEALPWNFRWKVLELNTIAYPTNRVRIELSTLSMDKQWLGV